jgi:uncharacterized membrane protein
MYFCLYWLLISLVISFVTQFSLVQAASCSYWSYCLWPALIIQYSVPHNEVGSTVTSQHFVLATVFEKWIVYELSGYKCPLNGFGVRDLVCHVTLPEWMIGVG